MISPMPAPISERYRQPPTRTPGRYEGLVHFAHTLARLFGPTLKDWTVLDVGGADGWLGELLAWRRYWWLDPQAAWGYPLAVRPPYWPKTLALQGRAERLPFRTASVDLVTSKQTLPHFEAPVLACREMCRVARQAVVIRQDWGYRDADGSYLPIGWPGHSRSKIDHPADILDALRAPGWSVDYDDTDFIARRLL